MEALTKGVVQQPDVAVLWRLGYGLDGNASGLKVLLRVTTEAVAQAPAKPESTEGMTLQQRNGR